MRLQWWCWSGGRGARQNCNLYFFLIHTIHFSLLFPPDYPLARKPNDIHFIGFSSFFTGWCFLATTVHDSHAMCMHPRARSLLFYDRSIYVRRGSASSLFLWYFRIPTTAPAPSATTQAPPISHPTKLIPQDVTILQLIVWHSVRNQVRMERQIG